MNKSLLAAAAAIGSVLSTVAGATTHTLEQQQLPRPECTASCEVTPAAIVLLAWTFIGWLIALAMARRSSKRPR